MNRLPVYTACRNFDIKYILYQHGKQNVAADNSIEHSALLFTLNPFQNCTIYRTILHLLTYQILFSAENLPVSAVVFKCVRYWTVNLFVLMYNFSYSSHRRPHKHHSLDSYKWTAKGNSHNRCWYTSYWRWLMTTVSWLWLCWNTTRATAYGDCPRHAFVQRVIQFEMLPSA